MSGALRYRNPALLDALARDYVLGTMTAPVRRRFKRLMVEQSGAESAVLRWEAHLQPWTADVPDQAPSPRLWHRLQRRLGPIPSGTGEGAGEGAGEHGWAGWWSRPSFLRWWGISGTVAAMALAIALLLPEALPKVPKDGSQDAPRKASYVAVLEAGPDRPVLIATARKDPWELTIELLERPSVGPSQTLVLWTEAKGGGDVQSLGPLGAGVRQQRPLTEAEWVLIRNAGTLLVSIEPDAAGSRPRGPVVYRGRCVQLPG